MKAKIKSNKIEIVQNAPRKNEENKLMLLQGKATNGLTQISTKKHFISEDDNKKAKFGNGDITVFIKDYKKNRNYLSTSALKLLDTFVIRLASQNKYGIKEKANLTVAFTLDEYLQLCGKPLTKCAKDNMRKKLKKDLENLALILLQWEESIKGKSTVFSNVNICTSNGFRRSKSGSEFYFNFTPELGYYLLNSYTIPFHKGLFSIDERNPYAYAIGRKLMLHNSISNNKSKGTANIISVKSLLKSCTDMPHYEKIMTGNRNLTSRIIEPFESSLNSISFIKWEYSNNKSKPLTEEQNNNFSYDIFIKSYIHFEIIDTETLPSEAGA